MSSTPNQCPRCGTTLPPSAPEGLCPRCLGALNFATETVLTGDEKPSTQPLLTPAQLAVHFPQLEIIECLGRGGMGVVYKARQKTLNRLVALKLLAPERVQDAKFAERFTHEAQALARLSHPNIVTIHDFGEAGGFYFLLMEFVDGVNLRQLLRARKLTPEEALAIVPPLCDALEFAHERGIVHRDIKPENLLLDKDGRIKIADFGIAKILGGNGARLGAETQPQHGEQGEAAAPKSTPHESITAGTPAYMAPEQKRAPHTVDSRADIYSLGVVFYELLTGELPDAKLQPPSRKVRIDVRLDGIVLRALEQTPELRWQTAGDLRTQVETLARSSAPSAIQSPAPEKGKWVAVAAACVGFYAAQILGIMLMNVLPGGFSRDYAYLALLAVLLTAGAVFAVRYARAWRHWLAAGANGEPPARAWLRALAILAFLLVLPLCSLSLFFLYAMQQETGSWNPALAEAAVVPLTWMGALGLPVCGWWLWRVSRVQRTHEPPVVRPRRWAPATLVVTSLVALALAAFIAVFVGWMAIGSYLGARRARASEEVARSQARQAELEGLMHNEADNVVVSPLLRDSPPPKPTNAPQTEIARLKLRYAETELERITKLQSQNLVSSDEVDQARLAVELARAELTDNAAEAKRIQLRYAERQLQRVEQLYASQLVSKETLQGAKTMVELARAEIAGNAVEVARVRLKQAEGELERISQLRTQKLIGEGEYNQARFNLELRRAELKNLSSPDKDR